MPTIPRVSGVLETSLYVEDLQRSSAFYQDLFGFTPFFIDDRMCALEVPNEQVLLLFRHGMTNEPAPGPGPDGFIPPHHGRGALHLCFAIPYGELGAWEAHLTRREIAVESRLRWPHGGTSLYFRVRTDIRWRSRHRACGRTAERRSGCVCDRSVKAYQAGKRTGPKGRPAQAGRRTRPGEKIPWTSA